MDELILARLRVYDDLAEATFTVDLEDVVALMNRPSEPGKRRPKIIALLNEHLLARYPQLAGRTLQELSVGIEEYADLKIEVAQELLSSIKGSSGPVK